MKKSRFSEHQILATLEQAEVGTTMPEPFREHGISSATSHNWRSKFGSMDTSMVTGITELKSGNRRLNKSYAEERLKGGDRPRSARMRPPRSLSGWSA